MTEEEISAYGFKASQMMSRDQSRFDAACELMRYLKEIHAPYYYLHRMSVVLHGNTEGTAASRAPDKAANQLPQTIVTANPTLALCDLAKPHLIEGARLFASKSIVVAVNDSQPLADRLADIELTVGLLTTLGAQLAKEEL